LIGRVAGRVDDRAYVLYPAVDPDPVDDVGVLPAYECLRRRGAERLILRQRKCVGLRRRQRPQGRIALEDPVELVGPFDPPP
jgi:hypothetical protein